MYSIAHLSACLITANCSVVRTEGPKSKSANAVTAVANNMRNLLFHCRLRLAIARVKSKTAKV